MAITVKSKTETRTQSVVKAIRAMIIAGDIQAGERVQVQRLADQLGVSRTPIAEALVALHREGLLEYGTHRGYGVKRFDVQSLLDAFDVRMVLEGLAARVAAERGLSSDVHELLEQNILATSEVLSTGEWSSNTQEAWRILNLEFHDLLLQQAHNAFLTEGIMRTRAVPPVFDTSYDRMADEVWPWLDLEFSRQALNDHKRLFSAISCRQAARAENMMKEHVFTSREKFRTIFELRTQR